jgi:hypothetical protein
MPFTTVAWAESQDSAGVFTTLNAVPDQHVSAVGVDIMVPDYNRIIAAMACLGNNADGRARLVSPSLRRVNPFHINPVALALLPGSDPPVVGEPGFYVPLDSGENLEAEEDANPAAAEQHCIAVWLADRDITPVSGKIYTARFTVALTLVVNTWAFGQIDTVDDLPTGNYAICGARLVCATGIVARFVPIGQNNRPGFPCQATVGERQNYLFRFGWLGEWFRFSTLQLPGIEVVPSAAAALTTYQGYMDVIPV